MDRFWRPINSKPYATFGTIIATMKSIVCAALLLTILAYPAVPAIEDSLTYEDYVDIGEIQPVDVHQGSSTTFSVSAANHGNLCYDVNLKFSDLPDGITRSPVESQTVDIGKTAVYQITIHASENASVGTYNIGIADNSAMDRNTWRLVALSVLTPLPPPTPAPTEKVVPVARGIPARPIELMQDIVGKKLTGSILFWLLVVLSVLFGIGAFMRHKYV